MAPEYGATAALFPVDAETLRYLRMTGRSDELVDLVERYCKEQTLFRTDETPDPVFNDLLELDLGDGRAERRRSAPAAGPGRARRRLPRLPRRLRDQVRGPSAAGRRSGRPGAVRRRRRRHGRGDPGRAVQPDAGRRRADPGRHRHVSLHHGAVAIAAITSCTNTSNPSVMLGAGLLAKKAVERGLDVPALRQDESGARLAGRHPLPRRSRAAALPRSARLPRRRLRLHDLHRQLRPAAGRRWPRRSRRTSWSSPRCSPATATSRAASTRRSRAASWPRRRWSSPTRWPARSTSTSTATRSAATRTATPVYLRDIWPTAGRGPRRRSESAVDPAMFPEEYRTVFAGDERWQELPVPTGNLYEWDERLDLRPGAALLPRSRAGAGAAAATSTARACWRCSATRSRPTTSRRPARSRRTSPAGQYLIENDVDPIDFNSYGSRRGNHEVMIRGTFANIRLRNELVPGKEGNVTRPLPDRRGDDASTTPRCATRARASR